MKNLKAEEVAVVDESKLSMEEKVAKVVSLMNKARAKEEKKASKEISKETEKMLAEKAN